MQIIKTIIALIVLWIIVAALCFVTEGQYDEDLDD